MHETNFPNGIQLTNLKNYAGSLLSINGEGVVESSTTLNSISGSLQTQITQISGYTQANTNSINTLFSTYANSTTVAAISAGLNTRINSIVLPTSATFLADYDNRYVNISGDSMTGRLNINGAFNTNVTQDDPDNFILKVVNTGNDGAGRNGGVFIQPTGDSLGLRIVGTSNSAKSLFQLRHNQLSINTSTGKAFAGGVSSESFDRFQFYSDGALGIGPGASTRDSFIFRSGVNRIGFADDAWSPTTGVGGIDVYGNIIVKNFVGNTDKIVTINPQGALQVGSNTISDLTLLSTTSNISGNLQSQINNKQDTLVSGVNIKTINGQSILGSGDLPIAGGNGTSWVPLASSGMTITAPTTANYIFSVTDYISKTEVASVSAGLQQQIDNKQDIITLVVGSNINIIESPLNTFTISSSGGTIVNGIQGRKQLDNINTTFTITHPAIDETIEFPVATLEVAGSTSDLYIVGIHNRTSTSFQVTLSGVADSNTYILWHISTQSTANDVDLSNYTLLSTTASISGNLQTQITNLTPTADNFYHEAPTNKTYPLISYANVPRTLTAINGLKTSAGTCTVAVQINGNSVAFTGSLTTLNVTSSAQQVAIISGGNVASTNRVTLVVTSVAGASDLEFTLSGVRT